MGETAAGRSDGQRWRDLQKRFLSALALGPATLLCIWIGGAAWMALVVIASAILAWEWVRLCGLDNRSIPGALVPASVLAAIGLSIAGMLRSALAVLLLGGGLAVLARRMSGEGARPSRLFALGSLYVGLGSLALLVLRGDDEAGRANTLFLFMVVWACDIGAYVAGRAFGGPKLAPAISPNKTWSGALGGLGAAVLTGAAVAQAMAPGGLLLAALLAILLGVASQAGDLAESAIKRHFGVKDTSGLIPGHGGLLDRLDGLMAAAPVAALIALVVGQGHPLWR